MLPTSSQGDLSQLAFSPFFLFSRPITSRHCSPNVGVIRNYTGVNIAKEDTFKRQATYNADDL